jgi:4-carboxymuconolactone decarboxylase
MQDDEGGRLSDLPLPFLEFVRKFPALDEAHQAIARAIDSYGPLDHKTQHLIKIGIAVGAGLETATKSHVRRARGEGATEAELEQAVLLAMNTCGLPRTVMAWRWIREAL